MSHIILSEQLRAARALLRWEQKDLAKASGVSIPTIARLETQPGPLAAYPSTIEKLRAALEKGGVIFTPANGTWPGVALKKRKGKR